jgi:hypothetical protein
MIRQSLLMGSVSLKEWNSSRSPNHEAERRVQLSCRRHVGITLPPIRVIRVRRLPVRVT